LPEKNSFLIIKNAKELTELDLKNIKELETKLDSFYVLTGSTKADFQHIVSSRNKIFNLDETVLKAMVRNYPSLMQVEKGIVRRKEKLSVFLKN
jgi:hypothetical protein